MVSIYDIMEAGTYFKGSSKTTIIFKNNKGEINDNKPTKYIIEII